ncbi:MAG: indole-3-glycerol-phosphate synthase [Woeseiaceae bacterium]
MTDFLEQMAEVGHARVRVSRERRSERVLTEKIAALAPTKPLPFNDGFRVIAEIKGHSPAEGELADAASLDRPAQARQYADGGAMAISVLTEETRFAGSLEHLADVSNSLNEAGPPTMRKDFIVADYQLLEARLAGAGGVLLIVAMLTDEALARMVGLCRSLGLFILLECFDAEDIHRAEQLLQVPAATDLIDSAQFMLGVNTRNLRTLEVDPDRLEQLAPLLPDGVLRVAESGLKVPADAARVKSFGYQAALIGTALMRSDNPTAMLRSFIQAGSA